MASAITLIHNIERQLLWWAGQHSFLEVQKNEDWISLSHLYKNDDNAKFDIRIKTIITVKSKITQKY